MLCELGDPNASSLAMCNREAVDCKVLRCPAPRHPCLHNNLTLVVPDGQSGMRLIKMYAWEWAYSMNMLRISESLSSLYYLF